MSAIIVADTARIQAAVSLQGGSKDAFYSRMQKSGSISWFKVPLVIKSTKNM
jgi:hypothetical protein